MKPNERGFDPKLKTAMSEIQECLRKHDCMAAVLLVSPTHSEFLNHFDASWSVMRLEDAPDGRQALRFRSKGEDWPSKEAQDNATEASVHALTSIIEWSRRTNYTFREIVGELGTKMKIAWETWEI